MRRKQFVRRPLMRVSAAIEYLALWRTREADLSEEKVVRNFACRQPLCWV
jgi:hypothetical protein